MRFFVGLSIAEIAHVTARSERTVKRQWQSARAWLLQSLET
jgi:DNA-directed RNA polymerase specialized sigma24 family protein